MNIEIYNKNEKVDCVNIPKELPSYKCCRGDNVLIPSRQFFPKKRGTLFSISHCNPSKLPHSQRYFPKRITRYPSLKHTRLVIFFLIYGDLKKSVSLFVWNFLAGYERTIICEYVTRLPESP